MFENATGLSDPCLLAVAVACLLAVHCHLNYNIVLTEHRVDDVRYAAEKYGPIKVCVWICNVVSSTALPPVSLLQDPLLSLSLLQDVYIPKVRLRGTISYRLLCDLMSAVCLAHLTDPSNPPLLSKRILRLDITGLLHQ
jgi:hypothetical protein